MLAGYKGYFVVEAYSSCDHRDAERTVVKGTLEQQETQRRLPAKPFRSLSLIRAR